ncbi:NAD-dependent epimerase/dehydratase family protein [Nakamurella endophytica]|uniref:Reductase n=1 Tax=Nakamurella endophytica TaxID=1748367 RepID=A0A917SYY9_9ACTN|nr:NAD-dependent epimerase/dehydratase family protein [Nakamurella endophytica]GGM01963.1 reductase [Nakamurella endophytica]
MDVLVIGGGVFLGPAVVSVARELGHRVTVFNRGRSAPPPAGVEHVVGDRTTPADLAVLGRRSWDVVVDTCGYVPAEVALSADVLAGAAGHYAFVSTVNVYAGWPAAADYHRVPQHRAPGRATREDAEELPPQDRYGWLKSGCEEAVRERFGSRCALLRAGCIVGPDDSSTGRLPWWLDRVARGGTVLAPGAPDDPVVLVDSRDLAGFALDRPSGTFEVTGDPVRRADLLDGCRAVTGSTAVFRWVGDRPAGAGVQPWTELPLWVPRAEAPSLFAHDNSRARAAGLRLRPLRDTLSDTWAWQRAVPGGWRPAPGTPGLDPQREAELLARWEREEESAGAGGG